jgi:P-type Ca2+ transporter type 2C
LYYNLIHNSTYSFGDNSKKASRIRPYYKVLWEQFQDPTLQVLLVAATLTLLAGLYDTRSNSWVEGVSIFFAVFFIALFASGTNYMKEKQFLKLDEEVRNEEVNIVRGQYGLSQPVQIFDVVVGDIILIETGMRVPADCVLIDGMDVTVDEAPYFEDRETINAKTLSVGSVHDNNHVSNPDPFLLADSLVMSGSGKAVVCAVGSYKYLHEINGCSNLVGIGSDDEANMTPLQQRLKRIANQLSKFGYTVGIVLFITMTAYLGIKVLITPQQLLENATLLQLINIFSICCAVIIVAVPEGLPLSISIAMAFSINIFKKDKLLLKKLAACEQMGQVTEICTGKTATLTKNDMTVSMFYLAEQTIKNVEKDTLTTSRLN